MRRIIAPLAAVMILAAAGYAGGAGVSGATVNDVDGAKSAPGRYIVVLDDSADSRAVAAEHGRAHGAAVTNVYTSALRGYAATMAPAAAERVAADPRVAFVEADQVVHALVQTVPTGIDRIADPASGGVVSAHLDADGIDEQVNAGVAVIDTGIDHAHLDLNVVGGADCTRPTTDAPCADGLPGDPNGHGTHVAGTIAGRDNGIGVVGVAPGARLYAVRVLGTNGSGYMSWIAAGVDWVTARAGSIKVANMSLGCSCSSEALDQALTASVAAGVVHVVAAGNSATDAGGFSPANHPGVITVSALADFNGVSGGLGSPTCRTDVDDTLADFSNYGSLVEIAAPGVCIRSTYKGGTYATMSGTSMASPHVAGAATLLASRGVVGRTAALEALLAGANQGWTNERYSPAEPLLDVSNSTLFTPVLLPAPPPPLTVSVTKTCSGTTCTFTGLESSATATAWSWTFGDGGTSAANPATHTYTAKGTFTVTVRATSADNSGTATTTVSCTGRGKKLSACS